jgi:hypothetical protein
MVLYFKLPLDHLGYPAKGPQIRGESGRSGPSPENLRQTLFLVSRKARGTAGMGFGAQSFYPLLLEHFFPTRNRGRGDADQTTHFPDSSACLEHPNGDHPAHFQSFCTPFGPHPTILPTCDRWDIFYTKDVTMARRRSIITPGEKAKLEGVGIKGEEARSLACKNC